MICGERESEREWVKTPPQLAARNLPAASRPSRRTFSCRTSSGRQVRDLYTSPRGIQSVKSCLQKCKQTVKLSRRSRLLRARPAACCHTWNRWTGCSSCPSWTPPGSRPRTCTAVWKVGGGVWPSNPSIVCDRRLTPIVSSGAPPPRCHPCWGKMALTIQVVQTHAVRLVVYNQFIWHWGHLATVADGDQRRLIAAALLKRVLLGLPWCTWATWLSPISRSLSLSRWHGLLCQVAIAQLPELCYVTNRTELSYLFTKITSIIGLNLFGAEAPRQHDSLKTSEKYPKCLSAQLWSDYTTVFTTFCKQGSPTGACDRPLRQICTRILLGKQTGMGSSV